VSPPTAEMARAVLMRPGRRPGTFEEEEKEVTRLADAGEAQAVDVYREEHHQYWAPFNYPNFRVELGRGYPNCEFNPDGVEIDIPPFGAITFVEDDPIIGVSVIGSSCSPPGNVLLLGEPVQWKYPRTGVKMLAENLWGEHINGYPWFKGVSEDWREAGLSSCRFDLPECRKVTLMGWSQPVIGVKEVEEYKSNDGHYCIRIVRVTVKKIAG